jgi:folate-binding protein YgfZ
MLAAKGMLTQPDTSSYEALTAGAGLLDRSERGKLALTGADAKAFLQGQLTNDIERLQAGGGCYAAFLTPKGKMLGDLRVLDAGAELLLDTERSALQALFNMIRRFSIGFQVELRKRTLERGLLSLIGPDAARVTGVDEVLAGVEHAHLEVEVDGVPVRAIRTYLGVDVLCESERAEQLAEALRGRGAVPVSEPAAEIVRVESGRPRWGAELDESVIPQEAGLNERAVSFTKGCYVGQETVARLHYRGKPNRMLRGLRAAGSFAAGEELRAGERVLGRVGSAVLSPRLGPIGLALVRREGPPGTEVTLAPSGVSATVVELPFP